MLLKKQPEYVSMTYPHNRPGPSRPDLRTTDIKTGIHMKEFNIACPSVPSIENIDWTTIRAIGKSEFGTSGVVFLETEEGACAIKGSQEIAVEYFSNLMFRALKIPIPEMRLIKWNEMEFKAIQENLDRCSYDKNDINRIVRSRMNCPFLLLMSYVPNVTIREMGEKRAKHIFDSNYPASRDRLIRIGMIIATDTFINNCDRYPLIWRGGSGEENEGNPDNLLINVETDYLSNPQEMKDPLNMNFSFSLPFAIDNRPNLLRKDDKLTVPNLIKYHKEFEKMLKDLFEELKEVKEAKLDPIVDSDIRFKSIEKTTNFIYRNSNYRLKSMSQLQIMLGMVLQYVNIVEMGSKRIQAIYGNIYSVGDEDWKDIWKNGFEKINLEFLEDSIGIIRKFLITFDEIVLWVKSITLQQYIIRWSEEDEKETYLIKKPKNEQEFMKNMDNFLRIEENLEDWELKDNGNQEEENEEDMRQFERDRKIAMEMLKNQQLEKNQWLDEKMKELFKIDSEGVKKQKILAEKEKTKKEQEQEQETIKIKKAQEEQEKKLEKKLEEKKKMEEEEEKQKKNKGWRSFFSKKPKKDPKKK